VRVLSRLIEQNVAQAQYLAGLIQKHADLELLAPVPLNVVCFRYCRRSGTVADLNALNQEILLRIQESGVALPSGTVLQDRYALRCAVVNHRSCRDDFDLLVDEVVRLGKEISAGD
jgi:aromatic-L-amino-acid decarboxylase